MNTGINEIECPECGNVQADEWQFCQDCLYNLHFSSVNSISSPTWVQTSNELLKQHGGKMDAKKEREIQDRIETEKARELKTSARARNWEEGRKRNWKADKPYYMKTVKK